MNQILDRRRPNAKRSARGQRVLRVTRCAEMPNNARQMEQRIRSCICSLDAPLAELARKYSPPVLMIALALELNRFGRAHISAGLLSAEQTRQVMLDASDFTA